MKNNQQSKGCEIVNFQGPFTALSEFLTLKERFELQLLSKRQYILSSKIIRIIPVPRTVLVLERFRWEFYLSIVTGTNKVEQSYTLLF